LTTLGKRRTLDLEQGAVGRSGHVPLRHGKQREFMGVHPQVATRGNARGPPPASIT
jgi:hypothetical protein